LDRGGRQIYTAPPNLVVVKLSNGISKLWWIGKPRPRRIWNKIPDKIETAIVNLALVRPFSNGGKKSIRLCALRFALSARLT
jgi:hypothetical protein